MVSYARLAELVGDGASAALCVVVATRGSTPRKSGARMVVHDDGSPLGSVEGTIGGGAVEHRVRQEAIAAMREVRPRLVTVELTAELGMCCGGGMTIFVEPLRTQPPCVVLGGGHVGQALAEAASLAGFAVTVADPREELLTDGRYPAGVTLVRGYDDEEWSMLPLGADTFVVVVTHDHGTDQRLVERALRRKPRYLAMVGSQRKAALTRQRLEARGFAPDLIALMRSPAGLDIGAETPGEIALSIVAEMVSVRRHERRDEASQASQQAGSSS